MEALAVRAPDSQANTEVPREIYAPLLEIAQRGYDANEIKHWYLTISKHLRRIGVENAEAAYKLATPASEASSSNLHFPQHRLFNEVDFSSQRAFASSPPSEVSPRADLGIWGDSFSFDPFQETQINMPPAMPGQQTHRTSMANRQDDRMSTLRMSAHWSPSLAGHEIDVNELFSAANESNFAGEIISSTPWHDPSSFNAINDVQQSQHSSQNHGSPPIRPTTSSSFMTEEQVQNPAYQNPLQIPIHSGEASMMFPYEPPPQASYPPPSPPIEIPGVGYPLPSNSIFSSPYGPAISIIPSRKRRKILQKRVKKIIQPLQPARQSI